MKTTQSTNKTSGGAIAHPSTDMQRERLHLDQLLDEAGGAAHRVLNASRKARAALFRIKVPLYKISHLLRGTQRGGAARSTASTRVNVPRNGMSGVSPPMEESAKSPTPSAHRPGEDWLALVRKSGTPDFAAAFAANPVLHTSVLNGPCAGVETIATVLGAGTGGMYDKLVFTHETVDGPKTFFEWEGTAFGKSVGGSTILTRNAAGLIQSIQIYHRPLSMVLQFSAELKKRLMGKVSANLFATRD